ncbi:YciI family protein [Paracoccus luteus]|uniref:YciI family protein n=1 Tax=Paracoccus luteus TaxID=2508543 RepID=UPI00106F588D|nr:YciI family protein [Paracoccus luteus]
MGWFLLRLRPPRASFPADATAAEGAAMDRHAAFWQARADAGDAAAVGPVLDPAGVWGLAIVQAADADAALALTRGDPVLTEVAGFSYEVLAMGGLIRPGG